MAAKSCRGLPAELAAKLVVKVIMLQLQVLLVSTLHYFVCIFYAIYPSGGTEDKGPEG